MTKEQTKESVARDTYRILIVDDHPIVRQGVRMLVDQQPDLEVCGETDNAHDALKLIDEQEPDLAVVDLTLKDSNGLDLIKDIQIRKPKILLLVLSMRDEVFYAERTLRAGARGYIVKEEGSGAILEGIRRVLQGEVYLSQTMASRMIGRLAGGVKEDGQLSPRNLTDRELEVFELIGRGLPTREIAQRLHLSVKTVDSHREHIKEKLGLGNATQLLKYAIQWVQMQKGR